MVVDDKDKNQKQGRSGLLKYLIRSDKARPGFSETDFGLCSHSCGRVVSCTGESLQLLCGISYAAH